MFYDWKITLVSEIEYVGEKETPKISFHVENEKTVEWYLHKDGVAFELFGNRADMLSVAWLWKDDEVRVHFNPKISEYNEKFYNKYNVWRIEDLAKAKQDKVDMKEAEENNVF